MRAAWLTVRLIRRGVAWLVPVVAFYAAVEAFSYERTYPDAASRQKPAALSDDPAMRILPGIPHALDTPGGFVAWDAGWTLAAITGIWALLTAGRLLRGEEESGRAELVLAGPIRPARIVLVQEAVIAGAALAGGASAAAGLNPLPVAVLATGLAVLLFGTRPRLTVPGSAAAVVIAYLVDMIGPALDWPGPVLDVSPFHHLASVPAEPFEPVAAAVMIAIGVLLAAAGVLLFERRDLTGD